jgi:hypothetical protein
MCQLGTADSSSGMQNKHSALSTQHSAAALSTQHSALNMQHSAFSTQHSALSTQHSAFRRLSTQFTPALSTQHSAAQHSASPGAVLCNTQVRCNAIPLPLMLMLMLPVLLSTRRGPVECEASRLIYSQHQLIPYGAARVTILWLIKRYYARRPCASSVLYVM